MATTPRRAPLIRLALLVWWLPGCSSVGAGGMGASATESTGGDSSAAPGSDGSSATGAALPAATPSSDLPSAQPVNPPEPACDASLQATRVPPDVSELPIGWASVEDLGQVGTTGGVGGEVVLARTRDELVDFAARDEPLVIQVCGLIEADAGATPSTAFVSVASNKTIVGVGTRPTLRVGLDLFEVSNVVIQNLFIEGAVPDGIATRRSHHVWIDHVDISDSSDGNLDLTNASDYITVSYSRFWYRDPAQDHRFSNLIGSSDNAPADVGKLRVTLHHNWWADNVFSRMPRVRYGDVHVFNNYYSSFGSSFCVFAGTQARVLVEGNYFQRTGTAIVLSGGVAVERDNVFDAAPSFPLTGEPAFEPPYDYALDAPEMLPELLVQQTGPLSP